MAKTRGGIRNGCVSKGGERGGIGRGRDGRARGGGGDALQGIQEVKRRKSAPHFQWTEDMAKAVIAIH